MAKVAIKAGKIPEPTGFFTCDSGYFYRLTDDDEYVRLCDGRTYFWNDISGMQELQMGVKLEIVL